MELKRREKMKFVKVAKNMSDGSVETALVNLSKVEVITYFDGYPVLWIGDEAWTCQMPTLEECIVEIDEI